MILVILFSTIWKIKYRKKLLNYNNDNFKLLNDLLINLKLSDIK